MFGSEKQKISILLYYNGANGFTDTQQHYYYYYVDDIGNKNSNDDPLMVQDQHPLMVDYYYYSMMMMIMNHYVLFVHLIHLYPIVPLSVPYIKIAQKKIGKRLVRLMTPNLMMMMFKTIYIYNR
ncbi:hypothetical protein DERP_006275 [Dermatophagoides pteronyssinus]|uniref:Uncharacterized protein n=1 Tax=Dermatophagoides pteronyssinus TaxID=6956 RepID=A0ABQ8IXZ5_DERPT|nr:hypothetical protein DERP_006275 [Dermatophagoides pteronyssinus]